MLTQQHQLQRPTPFSFHEYWFCLPYWRRSVRRRFEMQSYPSIDFSVIRILLKAYLKSWRKSCCDKVRRAGKCLVSGTQPNHDESLGGIFKTSLKCKRRSSWSVFCRLFGTYSTASWAVLRAYSSLVPFITPSWARWAPDWQYCSSGRINVLQCDLWRSSQRS